MTERDSMRRVLCQAWKKYREGQTLSALEQQIVRIIQQHAEYHAVFASDTPSMENFSTDTNPFLHVSLHLSLHEQLSTNRPTGIASAYQKLLKKHHDEHKVEHLMMDVMATILWESQTQGTLADEQTYLECLHKLL